MAAVGSCVSGSLVAARVRGLCTVLVTKSGAVRWQVANRGAYRPGYGSYPWATEVEKSNRCQKQKMVGLAILLVAVVAAEVEYVPTPMGYVLKHCVHEVPNEVRHMSRRAPT